MPPEFGFSDSLAHLAPLIRLGVEANIKTLRNDLHSFLQEMSLLLLQNFASGFHMISHLLLKCQFKETSHRFKPRNHRQLHAEGRSLR